MADFHSGDNVSHKSEQQVISAVDIISALQGDSQKTHQSPQSERAAVAESSAQMVKTGTLPDFGLTHSETQGHKGGDSGLRAGQHKNDFHYDGEPTDNKSHGNGDKGADDIVKTMKEQHSPDEMANLVAAELQTALKSGKPLEDLVDDVNKGMGDRWAHLRIGNSADGHTSLTMKTGPFGGTMLNIDGTDVKVGSTLR